MARAPGSSLLSFAPPRAFGLRRGFSSPAPPSLAPGSLPRLAFRARVPTVLSLRSAGISTCCPSATRPRLALGPDSPRADQLHPGNLGYSAKGIPTLFSLLIPAFSLPGPPPPLPARLPWAGNAPLPARLSRAPGLRRRVSAPDIFGAGPLG